MPCKLEQHPSAPQPPDSVAFAAITNYHHWAPASIKLASYFWDSRSCTCHIQYHALLPINLDITRAASILAHFNLAVNSFNSGHFLSTIRERGLAFKVVLTCDPFVHGCALFRKLSECKLIISSAAKPMF
jgi:hypothetical protein